MHLFITFYDVLVSLQTVTCCWAEQIASLVCLVEGVATTCMLSAGQGNDLVPRPILSLMPRPSMTGAQAYIITGTQA